MFVRSVSILGAAALFVAAQAQDASAFGRHHHGGKYKTCYKRVATPPVYQTVTRQVMVSPASCSQYRTAPTYGTVAREVVVQPSYQVVHHKPAVVGKVAVQKMVRPERTRWVRGRGCHGADYKCAITTPAKYRTRTRRVVVEPSSNWVETKPAVRGVVHQQVVLNAGQVRQVCQPARYQTVTQQVMVSPGTEQWVPVAHMGHSYAYHQTAMPVQQPVQYSRPAYRPMPQYPVRQAPLK